MGVSRKITVSHGAFLSGTARTQTCPAILASNVGVAEGVSVAIAVGVRVGIDVCVGVCDTPSPKAL